MSKLTGQPGIQNPSTVVSFFGVPITSDLGSEWDDAIQSLNGLNFTSIGGNPISQWVMTRRAGFLGIV